MSNRRRLGCEYDVLSPDNRLNQIVKSTILLLIRHADVAKSRKIKLARLLLFFDDVSEVDLLQVAWNNLRFDRNSRTYQTLCFICYFLIHDQLPTTEKGTNHMAQFAEENMSRLYEKFLLEYYKKHHPELKATAKQIDWNIRYELSSTELLPVMQSDIYLTYGAKALIIDAKYYKQTLQTYYNNKTIHSNNLFQISTYVTNADITHSGNVNGMLLYAKTSEEIVPDGHIVLQDGNIIYFKTLDLNLEFEEICSQLDNIVSNCLI